MRDTTYYITTPIYYVNDLPHIGHIYTTVMADVFARHHRMLGEDVRFLTGTDEHGQKIERAAASQGIPPMELAGRVVARYHHLWEQLEISHDDFIRTTEERHGRGVTEIIRRIQANGDIYKGEYSGWYCAGCEAFYPETQLVEGRCPDQGHPVELLSEPSYFFRLSSYQDRLLQWYADNPDCIAPRTRYNEVLRFVEGGLRDLSISRRSLKWGIPFPGDPDHVVYVWLDALTNYLSALGFGSEDDALYRRFWPAQVHLVGKDILRFHCVYWPAFLMSAGLPLPEKIFGHGWWMRDEAKMSKSLGNVVRPDHLLERFGPDALRYFLAREMTFGQDASFSDEAFLERYNADLANNLGNTASRTLSMTHRYLDGRVPAPGGGAVAEAAQRSGEGYLLAMGAMEPHRALEATWQLLSAVNGFIQERQPWSLAKAGGEGEGQLKEVLGTSLEGLRIVSLMIFPFMPGVARRLRDQLGVPGPAGDLRTELRWKGAPGGEGLGESQPLFPRIDIKAYLQEVAMENEKNEKQQPSDAREPDTTPAVIGIEELARVELKVGVIQEAERIPKSRKLLRLMVDLGEAEPRQIVAGIAGRYEPEDLLDRRVVIVANLKPVKLMGVESRGMVLAATDAEGQPFLLSPDGALPPGSEVR